ncbi:MAG TPA: hypothetical protein VFU89_03340 [Rhabdochlamydiaceae bacterium]|nr:hypothetical protein [Rhabdochlamydiaceae bacterium]
MAGKVPQTGSTTGANVAPTSLPGRAYNSFKGGVGATRDAIVSAASDFKTRGGTVLSGAFGTPISFVWNTIIKGCAGMVRDTLWGKKPPNTLIDIELKGWFGKYPTKMELDEIIKKRIHTPEELERTGKCTKAQLRERGHFNIEILYTTWTGTHKHNGSLRDAIDAGYITIDDAILHYKVITEAEATAGGLFKLKKPTTEVKK